MLKGIDPLLAPELLHTLAAMGHGDTIAIVDRNFPAASTARTVHRLDGVSVTEAARAILTLLPIDTFLPEPILRMSVVGDPGRVDPVHVEFAEVAATAANRPVGIGAVSRDDFYESTRRAFAVVVTGESRPYACFLISKGVLPEFHPADAEPS